MTPAKKGTPAKRVTDSTTAIITLRLFDGTRNALPDGSELLIRISDGAQHQLVNHFFKRSSLEFKVPFVDNFTRNYTVLTTAVGYRDAGFFPVVLSPTLPASVDLMLVPKKAQYGFLGWNDLTTKYTRMSDFLCCGSPDDGQRNYEKLLRDKPAALASLLNLTAAMSAIHLPQGTPLDYFRRIEWDESLAQDRFFGFADEAIVHQVETAASQGVFEREPAPGLFHRDATSSFKHLQFGEANVQLTFHEKTLETIVGVPCVRVEPDIDYYKDLAGHTLLEVVPNALSHGLTDPQVVYALRWIAGRHAGVPEFDPSYTLNA